MSPRRFVAIAFSASALLCASCSSPILTRTSPSEPDGRYDSEFPRQGSAKQLAEIAESVKMLSSVAYYRTYSFERADQVRRDSLTPEFLLRKRDRSVFINRSLSGTATIVSVDGRRVALLTCAHVVAFPDTLVEFHLDPDGVPTSYVRSAAFKERQMNFVGLLPEGGELEILAIDQKEDVALLGKTFVNPPAIPLRALRYPAGKARELDWGTFVYLFGYPSGYHMVTKGIVSSPNRDRRGSFLVDAVSGGGFSGGIALAIRDGIPNFEFVGLVKMVPARSSYLLAPRRDDPAEFDPTVPYRGEIFVERRTEIEYGITQVIAVEVIGEFLEAHRASLAERGYRVTLPSLP